MSQPQFKPGDIVRCRRVGCIGEPPPAIRTYQLSDAINYPYAVGKDVKTGLRPMLYLGDAELVKQEKTK